MDRPSSLLHGPTAPPPPPPLFAWTSPPPCYYGFSARWFCHTLQVRTAPSLHLPLFLKETFLHIHKGGSLCVLGICQLVGHRLVMPLLLRPQLVMHWLVMHVLAKDSPGWPGDVSVTDLATMCACKFTLKITVDKQRIVVRS